MKGLVQTHLWKSRLLYQIIVRNPLKKKKKKRNSAFLALVHFVSAIMFSGTFSQRMYLFTSVPLSFAVHIIEPFQQVGHDVLLFHSPLPKSPPGWWRRPDMVVLILKLPVMPWTLTCCQLLVHFQSLCSLAVWKPRSGMYTFASGVPFHSESSRTVHGSP